jgi:tetratricopeptide (TPR) repeat protein
MPISSPQIPKPGASRISAGSRPVAVASSAAQSRWFALLSTAIIAAAIVAVYWNSFSGAMVLDDLGWIRDNASIHQLSSIGDVLFPKNMGVLGGRPLVSLSLAINYAIGGTDPAGYHAVNLAIHLMAALTLFGLVRRTLMLPSLGDRFRAAATPLALAIALLWAVHPLTTAAVTYIIQRTESLMALLYLVTLYCFVRGATTSAEHPLARRLWYAASVLACALGMVTKEVMFTAPLVALLYDSFFLAGSFRRALSERRWLYGCLAATWSLGGLMLWLTGFHGGTTGFGVTTFTWQSYALTQPGVILHYFQVAFWPAGLSLDYGWPAAKSFWQIVIPGTVVLALLGATILGLIKRSPLGFLGACFFLILAPTSSFIPIKDAAFDDRMYLSLAVLAVFVVVGFYAIWNKLTSNDREPANSGLALRWLVPAALLTAGVAGLGWGTIERNRDFRSEEAIWHDVMAKRPGNWRSYASLAHAAAESGNQTKAIELYRLALERNPQEPQVHLELGDALSSRDEADEAIDHYRQAVKLQPDSALVNNALGQALVKKGQSDEAIARLGEAVRLEPDNSAAHNNLAAALLMRERFDEAIQHAESALAIDPNFALAHTNLGIALMAKGRFDEAAAQLREALAIAPWLSEAEFNLGIALGKCGRYREAIVYLERDLARRPRDVQANFNVAMLYDKCGQTDKAVAKYERVLALAPSYRGAHLNLGAIREQQGQLDQAIAHYTVLLSGETHDPSIEARVAKLYARQGDFRRAIAHFETALADEPRNADAHFQLAGCYLQTHQEDDAIQHYRAAIEIQPGFGPAHNDLAVLLARQGKMDEAEEQFAKAIEIDPKHASAHTNLGMVLLRKGKAAEAVEQWRAAAKLTPNDATLLRNLAWSLATSADPKVRNGAEAVHWAQRAVELSDNGDPNALGVLAGAYAEAGQFPKAVESGERALELANLQGQRELAGQLTDRLKLYRSGSPYHEPPRQ